MARTISTGPRTAAGKVRSSLNALRHGLAATHRRQRPPTDAVERLAIAICGGEDDPELLAAARAIAENAFVLGAMRQQKIVVIERLKEATAIALRKGDNSFNLARARLHEASLAHREIQTFVPQALNKCQPAPLPPTAETAWDDDIVLIRLKAPIEECNQEEQARALAIGTEEMQRRQRKENEELEEAIPDLIRLERYERRGWSRQKQAIQQLVLIKFARAMAAAQRMPTT
jgi:hypothetical protein